MSNILSLDTSNYTTSACILNTEKGILWENRMMIPVAQGRCGVRQSDAVFHHVKNLDQLFSTATAFPLDAVCASNCPSERENSYMPCFTVGVSFAKSLAALYGLPVGCYSHQKNHIMAALVSSGNTQLLKNRFLAYHVSGGTTDIMLCQPSDRVFSVTRIGGTADISCGQLIDRTGTLLGFPFPCGKSVQNAASGCLNGNIFIKSREGSYNFSGFQNKIESMHACGATVQSICDYVLDVVYSFLRHSITYFRSGYGNLPVVLSGGVMSNVYLSDLISNTFDDVYFSEPRYSVDNAAGIAWLCAADRGELIGQ